MRTLLRSLAAVGLAAAAAIVAVPSVASAAPTATSGTARLTGYDVSYPQCGTTLPLGQPFGIVGVNGGLATRSNPCLSSQLIWASRSTGLVLSQPRTQLYLNTANPGELRDQVTTWPKTGNTPYGTCTGGNTDACSWRYGWERAQFSVESIFAPAARSATVDGRAASYRWWLDVETDNTWQSGSAAALVRNRATLEGMTSYLLGQGAGFVGYYSTNKQWAQIVGSVPRTSLLAGRSSWLAGATTLAGASRACLNTPLVPGGKVTLAQYVSGGLDHDKSCG